MRAFMPLFWRVAGALVLGMLLARWFWILLAPRPTAIAALPQHAAAPEASRLFGQGGDGTLASGGTPWPEMRLAGVFAPGPGKPGFAVLLLEGRRQVGVAAGGFVAPGIRLVEVHPDHVLLDHGGDQRRVSLGKGAVMPAEIGMRTEQ